MNCAPGSGHLCSDPVNTSENYINSKRRFHLIGAPFVGRVFAEYYIELLQIRAETTSFNYDFQ